MLYIIKKVNVQRQPKVLKQSLVGYFCACLLARALPHLYANLDLLRAVRNESVCDDGQ